MGVLFCCVEGVVVGQDGGGVGGWSCHVEASDLVVAVAGEVSEGDELRRPGCGHDVVQFGRRSVR